MPCQISLFQGVLVQIEKLEDVADRVVDEFVAPVADHAGGCRSLPEFAVEMVTVLVTGQRDSIEGAGSLEAAEIQQRRHQVSKLCQPWVATAGAKPVVTRRRHDDEGTRADFSYMTPLAHIW